MNKRYLTWNDFENFISRAVKLFDGMKATGVYGLPRGGLTIAVTLSHRLGIPLLAAPCKGCIVVDDISDTGVSLEHYATSGYVLVTWVIRSKWTKTVPFFYGLAVDNDDWLVFPWEENTNATSKSKEESQDGTEQE